MTTAKRDALELATGRIMALIEKLHTGDDERMERRRVRASWAWADVRKYRSFVSFALEERRVSGRSLVTAHEEHKRMTIERVQTPRYEERRAELDRLTLRTHYAIESFFTFGKILLDRVALAIEATFGNAQGFRPTHGRLFHETYGLIAYSKARGVQEPPEELIARARELEETLTRFRDHMIVHPQNVRLRASGTLMWPTGEVDLAVGMHMATEGESEAGWQDAPSVATMSVQMEEYLAVVVDWVERCLTALAESDDSSTIPPAEQR